MFLGKNTNELRFSGEHLFLKIEGNGKTSYSKLSSFMERFCFHYYCPKPLEVFQTAWRIFEV